MYKINCVDCGQIGFHPSRIAAESRAETHVHEMDHDCTVVPMDND